MMTKQVKRVVALALALIMALALIPVTAKPVAAASFPSMSQIFIDGKSLASEMPKGVSYNPATGVMQVEWNHPDYVFGSMTVTGGTELTIEPIAQYGGGFGNDLETQIAGIYAPDCDLVFRGSGYLLISVGAGIYNEYIAGPYFAGIVAKNVTFKDSVDVDFMISNHSAATQGYGIKASGDVVIKDHATISGHINCICEHSADKADIGICAEGKISISSDKTQGFFTYDKKSSDKRYVMKASSIEVSNTPYVSAANAISLTGNDGWAPIGYHYETGVNEENGYDYEAWKQNQRDYYSRAGSDRYQTAIEIALDAYHHGPSTGEIVIVTGQKFPDALAANGYAGIVQAPILLSQTDKLNENTKALLAERWAYPTSSSRVTVIGNGFSERFYNDLKELGFSESNNNIKTIGGADRYATAEAVAEATLEYVASKSIDIPAVAVTTGAKPFDAMSFSPWAYRDHIPILLVSKGQASEKTKALIAKFDFVYLLGSDEVCSESCLSAEQKEYHSYERLAGPDRYSTSQAIANCFVEERSGGTYNGTGFADGTQRHYVDALVAGMLMGKYGTPIILMDEGASGEKIVQPWVKEKLAGMYFHANYYYFIGWAAEGKSSEFDKLVSWIESNRVK